MEILITVVIFFILSRIGKQNRLLQGQKDSEERVPARRTPTPNKPVRPMVEKLKPTAKPNQPRPKERKMERQAARDNCHYEAAYPKESRTESVVVAIMSRELLPEWNESNVLTAERRILFPQAAASIIIVISAGKNYRRG